MSEQVKPLAVRSPGKMVGFSVEPQNFAEMMEFCKLVSQSDLVPKEDKDKPGNILLKIQHGQEIGLKAMQAIQGIAVINGRTAVWGDHLLAIVKAHPSFEWIRETHEGKGDGRLATCVIKRKGEPEVERAFSVDDARRAGLWGKNGPWSTYSDRMLQLRARGFAVRDAFPDALKGIISVEEAQDIPVDVTPLRYEEGVTRGATVENKLAAVAKQVGLEAGMAHTPSSGEIELDDDFPEGIEDPTVPPGPPPWLDTDDDAVLQAALTAQEKATALGLSRRASVAANAEPVALSVDDFKLTNKYPPSAKQFKMLIDLANSTGTGLIELDELARKAGDPRYVKDFASINGKAASAIIDALKNTPPAAREAKQSVEGASSGYDPDDDSVPF